jgi:hypothetical protein
MSRSFLRKLIFPLAILSLGAVAGVKAGIEYAKGNYVSKDRKFIEGEIIKDKKKK